MVWQSSIYQFRFPVRYAIMKNLLPLILKLEFEAENLPGICYLTKFEIKLKMRPHGIGGQSR